MGFPWAETIGGVTATASAGAAIAAWLAAKRANETADAVARIERERWHADLTPQFEIAIDRTSDDRATLDVQLRGPVALRRLDEIAIVFGDDDADRTIRLPSRGNDGRPTQEDIDNQVWGPYQFSQGADGADDHGRTVNPFSLRVGRGRPLAIAKTRAPFWQEGNDAPARWRNDWEAKPLRLVLTCRHDDHEPWTIPCEIENPGAPRVRWT